MTTHTISSSQETPKIWAKRITGLKPYSEGYKVKKPIRSYEVSESGGILYVIVRGDDPAQEELADKAKTGWGFRPTFAAIDCSTGEELWRFTSQHLNGGEWMSKSGGVMDATLNRGFILHRIDRDTILTAHGGDHASWSCSTLGGESVQHPALVSGSNQAGWFEVDPVTGAFSRSFDQGHRAWDGTRMKHWGGAKIEGDHIVEFTLAVRQGDWLGTGIQLTSSRSWTYTSDETFVYSRMGGSGVNGAPRPMLLRDGVFYWVGYTPGTTNLHVFGVRDGEKIFDRDMKYSGIVATAYLDFLDGEPVVYIPKHNTVGASLLHGGTVTPLPVTLTTNLSGTAWDMNEATQMVGGIVVEPQMVSGSMVLRMWPGDKVIDTGLTGDDKTPVRLRRLKIVRGWLIVHGDIGDDQFLVGWPIPGQIQEKPDPAPKAIIDRSYYAKLYDGEQLAIVGNVSGDWAVDGQIVRNTKTIDREWSEGPHIVRFGSDARTFTVGPKKRIVQPVRTAVLSWTKNKPRNRIFYEFAEGGTLRLVVWYRDDKTRYITVHETTVWGDKATLPILHKIPIPAASGIYDVECPIEAGIVVVEAVPFIKRGDSSRVLLDAEVLV